MSGRPAPTNELVADDRTLATDCLAVAPTGGVGPSGRAGARPSQAGSVARSVLYEAPLGFGENGWHDVPGSVRARPSADRCPEPAISTKHPLRRRSWLHSTKSRCCTPVLARLPAAAGRLTHSEVGLIEQPSRPTCPTKCFPHCPAGQAEPLPPTRRRGRSAPTLLAPPETAMPLRAAISPT